MDDNNNKDKPKFEVIKNDNPNLSPPRGWEGQSPKVVDTKTDSNIYAGDGPVRLVRLITGEMLIGKFKPLDNFKCRLTKPMTISAQVIPDGSGQQRLDINMMLYMPFSIDESFEFQMLNIMNVSKPVPDMEANYNRLNSSIVTPTTPGLILPS